MRHFHFWCQKVLPLVYDDSLGYYEVLCKVVDYINKLIDQDKIFGEELDELRQDLTAVQEWIEHFDTSVIEKYIQEYIATMVFFGLTESGYFAAYIPDSWETIQFNTTEYDIHVPLEPDFGHLVLSY